MSLCCLCSHWAEKKEVNLEPQWQVQAHACVTMHVSQVPIGPISRGHLSALAYARPSICGTRRSFAPRNIITGVSIAPSPPTTQRIGDASYMAFWISGDSGKPAPCRVLTAFPDGPLELLLDCEVGRDAPKTSTKHQSGMSVTCTWNTLVLHTCIWSPQPSRSDY
jgi:hypothetical protein